MSICTQCNKTFSSISAMNRHQKGNACLRPCTYCKMNHPTKSMNQHHSQCVEKLKLENLELKNELLLLKERNQSLSEKYEDAEYDKKRYIKQIIDLQNNLQEDMRQLSKAVKKANRQKPSTIINNNITIKVDNLQVLNFEDFERYAEMLTIDHIKKGVSGYVEFALTYPLNNKIICTDFSRRKIKYKAPNNLMTNDFNLSLISAKLFQSLITRTREEIFKHIDSVDDIEEKMRLRLLYSDYIDLVRDGSQGIKHTLYPDFVKGICTLTN